jgi:hypothetical protein
MTHLFQTLSVVSVLALVLSVPDANAGTEVQGWRVAPLAIAADGTKTHQAFVTTNGDVPDSVDISLVPSDPTIGEPVDVAMTSPVSGTVLTSGSLQLLIQPEGGTATLVLLGLGNGVAVGDEFEVILPLHPEDGGEADVVFSEGSGVLSATTTPVEGELDAYLVTLSLDFSVTGDIEGLSYFDVTVQETDGDVTVIDEQAELTVDGSQLRWRTSFDTSPTSAALVDYQGTVTTRTGDIASEGALNSVSLTDSDASDELVTTAVASELVSRTRTSGAYKLISTQMVFVPEGNEIPTVAVAYTNEADEPVGAFSQQLKRQWSLFAAHGVVFEDDAVGSTLTIDVEMLDASGEVIATDTVDIEVKPDWAQSAAHRGSGDGFVFGSSADTGAPDGTVSIRVAIGGDRAKDVTRVVLNVLASTGPSVVGETAHPADRHAQLLSFRGSSTVATEYADATLGYTVTLKDGSGIIEAKEKEEKPKKRKYTRPRRAMKTTLNLPCCGWN